MHSVYDSRLAVKPRSETDYAYFCYLFIGFYSLLNILEEIDESTADIDLFFLIFPTVGVVF